MTSPVRFMPAETLGEFTSENSWLYGAIGVRAGYLFNHHAGWFIATGRSAALKEVTRRAGSVKYRSLAAD